MRIGVAGASGYLGRGAAAPAGGPSELRCRAWHKATVRPGRQVAQLYPNLAPATAGCVFSPLDPVVCEASTPSLIALPSGRSQELVPALVGSVSARGRPGRGLPPAGRLAVPDLVRVRAHGAGAARHGSSTGCPSCSATKFRLRARRGARLLCHRGRARLAPLGARRRDRADRE